MKNFLVLYFIVFCFAALRSHAVNNERLFITYKENVLLENIVCFIEENSGKIIIVVDDDAMTAVTIKKIFENQDYFIVSFRNGDSFLSFLRETSNIREIMATSVIGVILDNQMPGTQGSAVIAEINKERLFELGQAGSNHGVRVIFNTSDSKENFSLEIQKLFWCVLSRKNNKAEIKQALEFMGPV